MAVGPVWFMQTHICRRHVAGRRTEQSREHGMPTHATAINASLMRLLACIAAALPYFWQEQAEYSFPPIHFAVFVLGVGILSASLCLFRRGPRRIQPPEPIACTRLKFRPSSLQDQSSWLCSWTISPRDGMRPAMLPREGGQRYEQTRPRKELRGLMEDL